MAKEWTEEEVRKLISESAQILREDRDKETYGRLHEKYGQKPEDKAEPGEGDPPPKKEAVKPPAKRSIWFGERIND